MTTVPHVMVSSFTVSVVLVHLLHSSIMTLPAFLGSIDRQERQLSHPSSEDRVKSPSEGAYICFCHIRIQKNRYRIEIILSTMPGTASCIRSSTSGNYFKHGEEEGTCVCDSQRGKLEAIPY